MVRVGGLASSFLFVFSITRRFGESPAPGTDDDDDDGDGNVDDEGVSCMCVSNYKLCCRELGSGCACAVECDYRPLYLYSLTRLTLSHVCV